MKKISRTFEIRDSFVHPSPVFETSLHDEELELRSIESTVSTQNGQPQDLPVPELAPEKDQDRQLSEESSALRILLIDDDAFNRRIGQSVLEKMGHRDDVPVDGLTAVRFYHINEYELVVLDLRMSETCGCKPMKRIRGIQEQQGQCVPIITLSGQTSILDDGQALTAGKDESLTNPLSQRNLHHVIDDAVPSRCDLRTGSPNRWSLAPDFIRATFPMSDSSMKLVVTLFQESCVERLEQIRRAFDNKDKVEIGRELHALKGSISMFASSLTVELLSNLELKVKQGHWLRAKLLLDGLERVIECLQPTLDQLLQDSS